MENSLNIQILVDKESWIIPYCLTLKKKLKELGHQAEMIFEKTEIKQGDILIMLGWGQIINREELNLHKYNLVVHESALPQGKGWSPLTWQILEGKHEVPITLFEAEGGVDSGAIYFQDIMKLKGYELVDELRKEQGMKSIELILKFINNYPDIFGKKQQGKASFYPRRGPKDSEVDVNKTIKQIFNNLRVADNKRYPVFFKLKVKKYILRVYKDE